MARPLRSAAGASSLFVLAVNLSLAPPAAGGDELRCLHLKPADPVAEFPDSLRARVQAAAESRDDEERRGGPPC